MMSPIRTSNSRINRKRVCLEVHQFVLSVQTGALHFTEARSLFYHYLLSRKHDPSVSRAADSSLYAREPMAVPFHSANSRSALPPLCKGRWVGVSRAGGIVPQATMLCRLTPRIYSHLISATRRGGQCAANIGNLFNCVVTVTHCGRAFANCLPLKGEDKGAPVSAALSGRDTAMTVSAGAEVRL